MAGEPSSASSPTAVPRAAAFFRVSLAVHRSYRLHEPVLGWVLVRCFSKIIVTLLVVRK
jgi:hypothetical protein